MNRWNTIAWVCLVSLLCVSTASNPASACTTFKSPFPGDPSIARNVDWYAKYQNIQGFLVMNPSGLKKVGELLGAPVTPAQWVSKWKSVSFSIAGAEFPNSGFNEKGLSMEILELPETQWPAPNDPRPATGAAQFVQYSLDTSATIDDVIASTRMVRPYSGFKMHYLTCDASGRCAVLQWIAGEVLVYRDGNLPYQALTNSPYPKSAEAAHHCTPTSCDQPDTSLWRFAQASLLRSEMDPTRSFGSQASQILDHVAQASSSITRFQVIYNSRTRDFAFRKKNAPKYVHLKIQFDGLKCGGPRPVILVQQDAQGNLVQSWQPLTRDMQLAGALGMGLPSQAANYYADYPFKKVSCVE